MAKTLGRGDKVSWDSSGGHSIGKVVKKQTTPTQIKGYKVVASFTHEKRIHSAMPNRPESRLICSGTGAHCKDQKVHGD
jgi:Hypervirulence associated proteins TUDOR domain